jgi:hypothetical protein
LLTNTDMLACNQNGIMAELSGEQDSVETWRVFTKGSSNSGYAGIFNRSEAPRTIKITPTLLGLRSDTSIRLHDVWADKNLSVSVARPSSLAIQPRDVIFIRFETTR